MSGGSGTGFSCTCGQVTGQIRVVSPETAVRARCFCADCRAAELYHNQPDPGEAGVDLVMTDPAEVSIDQGIEKLAAIKIYRRGILRWYASCCGARLFNTAETPRVVFITILANRLADPDAAGPEQAQAFVPVGPGKSKHKNASRLYLPTMTRSLIRFFNGQWRDNPLYDPEAGAMRTTPYVLTREERRGIGLA